MSKCSRCGNEVSRYQVIPTRGGNSLIVCLDCNKQPSGYRPFKAYWDGNIADKPVYIESDRQRERLMKENNLAVRPREHIDDLNQRRYQRGLPPLRS